MGYRDQLERAIGKFWLRSKTIAFNAAVLVLGLVVEFGGLAPTLHKSMGPDIYGWVLFGVGAANIALRLVTKAPVRMATEAKAVEQHAARLR